MAYARNVTLEHREVSFGDYISHTWDFLTLDLPTYIFQLYDRDGSGQLDRREYAKIAEAVYNMKFGENHKLDREILQTDTDHSGTISYDEFVLLTKRDQNVNRHAFYIQDAMRQHIGGLPYWQKLQDIRCKKMGKKTLHQIMGD